MAPRSFDSQTRLGIPRPSKSFVTEHAGSSSLRSAEAGRFARPGSRALPRGELLADEGTLILEPAPISVAPPSSMRPVMYSVPPTSTVRPSVPSWDDRSGWSPTKEITRSTRIPPTAGLTARDRSASAMLLIATVAMLAALASIGFMHKASRGADAQTITAASQPVPSPVAQATITAPPAAPVAPPVAAIDIDDVTPASVTVKPAAAHTAPAPVEVRGAAPSRAAKEPKETKDPKEKAPAQTAQQKALEDLLEQLGEEQLKR